MRRTVCVGLVLLLALCLLPALSSGQQAVERGKSRLGQNYPKPFRSPETQIPFVLFDEDFVHGRPVVVSIRIRNVLGEVVAVPVAVTHPDSSAVEVTNLEYATPGEQVAYWNGQDRFGQKVASGIYYVELVVNGERAPPRPIVVGR